MIYTRTFWKVIVWSVLILIGSSVSTKELEGANFIHFENMDKIAHFISYYVLVLFLVNGFTRLNKEFKNYSVAFLSFSIAVTYGGIMEILQLYFFNRTADIIDFIFNSAGALIGLMTYRLVVKIPVVRSIILN